MKKFLIFVFAVSILFPFTTKADSLVNESGIDLELSEIMLIDFSVEIAGNPIPIPAYPENKSFESLGITGITPPISLQKIFGAADSHQYFRSAGTYDIRIKLVDNAGNTSYFPSESTTYTFTITATDPNSSETSIAPTGSCTTGYANADDTCRLNIIFKDQFGNYVTQLTNAGFYSSTTFTDDANLETNFRSGLRISPSTVIPTSAGASLTTTIAAASVDLVAYSPSLQKFPINNGKLATLVERSIDFDFDVKDILNNGTLGSTTIPISKAVPLKFKHLYEIKPSIAGGTTYLNPQDTEPDQRKSTTMSFGITKHQPLITTDDNQFQVENLDTTYLKYAVPLEDPPPYPAANYSGIASNPLIENSIGNPNYVFVDDDWSGEIWIDIPAADVPSVYPTSVVTIVDYKFGTIPVKYPAGGAGLHFIIEEPWPDPEETWTRAGFNSYDFATEEEAQLAIADSTAGAIGYGENMGVDIGPRAFIDHGYIAGDIYNLLELYAVGGENFKETYFQLDTISGGKIDLSKDIRTNAYSLMQGVSAEASGNFPSSNLTNLFSANPVVVINGDATLTENFTLPAGKNTLIIHNGNLFIKENVTYNVNTKINDSFGVILINDNVTDNTIGNILIQNNVTNIAGIFYADGSLITATANDFNQTNNKCDRSSNTSQLVMDGILFSRNTIGGWIQGNEGEGDYMTPWGTAATPAEAELYDLHCVRQYTLGTGERAIGELLDPSFIIRPNVGKITKDPPPGFATFSTY